MGKPPLRGEAAIRAVAEVPAHLVAEVLDGALHVFPRPRGEHANVTTNLTGWVKPAFGRRRGGHGGWILLFEPELHAGPGPDIVVPDVAGWRRERLPGAPDTAFFPLAPDWVCEVLSPSTEHIDRNEKLPIYARESVRHVWLIEPEKKHLEVLELDGASYRSTGAWTGEATVRAAPFEAEPLQLGELWEW